MLSASNALAYAQGFVWIVAALSLLSVPTVDGQRLWFKAFAFVVAIVNIVASVSWLNEAHMGTMQPGWATVRLLTTFAGCMVVAWSYRYRATR